MSSILSFLLSVLLIYKYWAIFGVVFLAAVIIPLPANTLLLAAGAFASQGYFSFTISLLAAMAGSVLGDSFDFFLARRYGRRALDMLHVRIPANFERLERFVGQHPGGAVFLTRFVGTVGSLTSLLCGFIGVPFKKFIAYDVLGNLVSNSLVIYAGYFLGSHWQDFMGLFNIGDYILLAIAVIATVFIMMWRKKRSNI